MDGRQNLSSLTSGAIADRLKAERFPRSPGQELAGATGTAPRPAAVLLPLFRLNGDWRLLYIRRAEFAGDRHSGEVAFPGGRCEHGDRGPAATALREAQEEIGLDPHQVELLGELCPFRTVSDYLVTPVVGCIPWPLDLHPDPAEVARVFSVPLHWLNESAHRRVRTWPSADHPQARDVVFFDEFDGERLWGVSARITLDFLACLTGHPETMRRRRSLSPPGGGPG